MLPGFSIVQKPLKRQRVVLHQPKRQKDKRKLLSQTKLQKEEPMPLREQDLNLSDMLETAEKENSQQICLWKIEDFEILVELGRGKFGQVFLAREKKSDFIVALKKMSREELQVNHFEKQIRRQIIIQSSLRHENLLKLFGYFSDSSNIYLILQYAAGGQLFTKLKSMCKFPEREVSIIVSQVCQGLSYLHEKGVIHRDIKPENILLSLGKVKLADFGWSIHSYQRRSTLCGTLDYLAPEMVKGSTHDRSVDIWQVGVLAYQLAVGRPPFETGSYNDTYKRILNEQVSFPGHVSFELRQFIRKCLQKKPQKRISVEECLQEWFLRQYAEEQIHL